MSEDEMLKPHIKWLTVRLRELREAGAGEYLWGDEGNVTLAQFQTELTLLNLNTQNRLKETIERSIKSQDRLANTQIGLTVIGAIIALFQLIGMFIIP